MMTLQRRSRSLRAAALLLALGFAAACAVRRAGEDTTVLSTGEAQPATDMIYAFWRANRSHDSTAIRGLSTSDQPLRYAQAFWGIEGAFPDSTNLKVLYAYRVVGMRDTVIVEVDLLHMECPPHAGGGAVHWRFVLVPPQAWRIAELGGDPC
jgi:hypothetical protein